MSIYNHLDMVAVTIATSLFLSVSGHTLVSIGNHLDIVAVTIATSLCLLVCVCFRSGIGVYWQSS